MTNNEIYKAVLHILAESEETAKNAGYDERFLYTLALFCGEAEETDDKYRLAKGLPQAEYRMRVMADPDEDFPLCDVFISSAAYYCSALLIADVNSALSDKLFEKYTERMSLIFDSLPSELENIKNVYY